MSNEISSRVMVRFVERFIPEPMSGCWLWMGCLDRKGYGRFGVGYRQEPAQRHAWRLFRGEPGSLHVLHKCDNPPCVNPDHLFLGTNLDNIQDRKRKGRGAGFASGQANPSAKLSRDAVRALLVEHAVGATGRALALKYGVSESTTSRIINGLRWKGALQ